MKSEKTILKEKILEANKDLRRYQIAMLVVFALIVVLVLFGRSLLSIVMFTIIGGILIIAIGAMLVIMRNKIQRLDDLKFDYRILVESES